MRVEKDIQLAHDILHFLAMSDAPPVFHSHTAHIAMHAAHDALAWVLGFPCGEAFAGNLQVATRAIHAAGFREVDMGRPLSPEEQKERGL